MEKPTSKKSTASSYGLYSSIAFQLVITVVVGTWIGRLLDDYFHNSAPIITVLFAILSTIAGLYLFFKRVLNQK